MGGRHREIDDVRDVIFDCINLHALQVDIQETTFNSK